MLHKILITVTSHIFLKSGLIILALLLLSSVVAIFWIKKRHQKESNFFNQIGSAKIKWLTYAATGLSALIIVFAITALSIKPKVIFPTSPSLEATIVSRDKPFEIKFDRPINKRSIKGEVSPAVKGDWVVSSGFFKKEHKLIFVPSESLQFETRYTISLSGIKNYFSRDTKYLCSFQIRSVPKVVSVSPPDGDEGALPNQEIMVETENFSSDQIKFYFELNPAVPVEVKNEGSKFTITHAEDFKKGTSYNLKIYYTLISYDYDSGTESAISEKKEALSSNFKIVDAPGVKKYSPTGTGILIDTPIAIEFKQDMDRQSVEGSFALTPAMPGKFAWSDNRNVSFDPNDNFQKNTKYTVNLSKGAKTSGGETIEEGLSYSFTTIGPVMVSSFSPGSGAKSVDINTKIKVTFNQAVDHPSAESKFSLSPAKDGSFSWSGNAMTFSSSGLSYSQSYTIKISSGVKTILGLDSNQDFSAVFETGSQSTTLNVPAYKQAHMYSCMITSARSALAYRGISVSEATIIGQVGYDSTIWSGTWNEPGSTWGDPDTGIVGSLDGKADNIGWGYGSYWGPISSAISSLGRSNEVKSGMSASTLAAEIAAGNPVIIWWVNGVWPSYELFWYKDAKRIRAVNGMHVVVVKGFTGTIENPSSFTVTDSGYGYPGKAYDAGTFMAKWGWFGNVGIVVR